MNFFNNIYPHNSELDLSREAVNTFKVTASTAEHQEEGKTYKGVPGENRTFSKFHNAKYQFKNFSALMHVLGADRTMNMVDRYSAVLAGCQHLALNQNTQDNS